MRRSARAFTLVELVAAMGLGLIVLGVGYRLWFGINRADEYAARRESMMLSAQNLMAKVKRDVRAAGSARASGDKLLLSGGDGPVTYRSFPGSSQVRRTAPRGGGVFREVRARFEGEHGGVRVSVTSDSQIHRRPIHVEISSFVSPRN